MWLSFWSYWNPVSILVVPNIRKRSFWTCFQKVRWARGIVFQICNQWTVVSLNMYLMIWLNWDRMMFLFTNATFDWLIHVFCYCTCDVCVLCCVSGLIAVVLLNRIGKFVSGKFCCCMVPLGEPPQYKVRFSDHLKTTAVQYYSVFSDIFHVMALICLVFGRWIRWLAIFVVLVLMTWRRAWRTWRGEHPTARRGRSPLSRPTCPPRWTVWRA